jgi:hypothetical protein
MKHYNSDEYDTILEDIEVGTDSGSFDTVISEDDDNDDDIKDAENEVDNEDISLDDIEDADDVTADFDPEDLSDLELEELDRELASTAADIKDDEVKLTPDEEKKADDMMQLAATTLLVKDALSDEEKREFVEDQEEVNTVLNEGFMTEADIEEIANDVEVATEAAYGSQMKIILDRQSRMKQLRAIALNVVAAAKNDPDYKKYKKLMKAKKFYRLKLEKKYGSEANKRAKVYFNRLMKSGSKTMNKISKKK